MKLKRRHFLSRKHGSSNSHCSTSIFLNNMKFVRRSPYITPIANVFLSCILAVTRYVAIVLF